MGTNCFYKERFRNMTTKQMARLGLFYIEEAILEVLEAESEPLDGPEISRRVGIESCSDPDRKLENAHAVVHGVLVKLLREERVDRVLKQQGKLEFRYWVRKGNTN